MRGSFEPASRVHTITGVTGSQNVDDSNSSNKRILLHLSVHNPTAGAVTVVVADQGNINITVNVPANSTVPNIIAACGLIYLGQLTVNPSAAGMQTLVGIA